MHSFYHDIVQNNSGQRLLSKNKGSISDSPDPLHRFKGGRLTVPPSLPLAPVAHRPFFVGT